MRTRLEVDIAAVIHNIAEEKRIISKDVQMMVVIKADGYGHGAVPIAKALQNYVEWFGVALLEEAIQLRENGIKNSILILGSVEEGVYKDIINYGITTTIFSFENAKKLSDIALSLGKVADIHIKIDSGMGRIGYVPSTKSVDEIQKICSLPGVRVSGMFTHFSKADEEDKSYTYAQIQKFNWITEAVRSMVGHTLLIHAANSAGIIDFPKAHFDMVRSGIISYGLYPSQVVSHHKMDLRAVMSWYTHVSYVKEVEAGSLIGYGGTFITPNAMKVATIPVGYADGYSRGLSNKGRVLINGKSAPIIGRICMDQFMVDVTHIEAVSVGNKVTLIGKDENEQITVDEIAELLGTINYEVVCDIGKRVPRTYIY